MNIPHWSSDIEERQAQIIVNMDLLSHKMDVLQEQYENHVGPEFSDDVE